MPWTFVVSKGWVWGFTSVAFPKEIYEAFPVPRGKVATAEWRYPPLLSCLRMVDF